MNSLEGDKKSGFCGQKHISQLQYFVMSQRAPIRLILQDLQRSAEANQSREAAPALPESEVKRRDLKMVTPWKL